MEDEYMITATLKSGFLRKETFWIGFALYFCGLLVPESVTISSVEIGTAITVLGGLLIMVQIVISILVILRAAYEGWRYGYAEGQIDGRA